MTERRETDRKRGKLTANEPKAADWSAGERIAKWLAAAGVCSRREAEKLIEDGRVAVNGEVLESPAVKVSGRNKITVDGKRVGGPDKTRLFRFHKPKGLVTTNSDPEGRPTVFEALPKGLPRVVTVGRLDLNTEGLLLLTNDGELARALELPSSNLKRKYRARAYGEIDQHQLDTLRDGITYEGIEYKSIIARLQRRTGDNNWIDMTLTEGKKREARRALESLGLRVNRLIRVAYGPFELENLPEGAVVEVPAGELLAEFGEAISRRRRPDSDRLPQEFALPETAERSRKGRGSGGKKSATSDGAPIAQRSGKGQHRKNPAKAPGQKTNTKRTSNAAARGKGLGQDGTRSQRAARPGGGRRRGGRK